MRVTNARTLLGCVAALCVVMTTSSATAAFIMYSENFDDRIRTTTNVVGAFPAAIGSQAAIPAGGSGASGWVGTRAAGTGGAMDFRVDNGTDNAGALYSFGTSDAGAAVPDVERALGAIASGTQIGAFGVEIVNNQGIALHEATITYTGEFWRSSTTATNTLTFAYSTGPSGSTTFLTGPATAFPALDLVGPAPVAANGALNGDLPVNQVLKTATITGLNWKNGESLYIRFTDANDGGNDAGLAVDNFMVIIPEPASASLMLLAAIGLLGRRRVGR
jgi:hypothetical protein